MPSKKSSDQIHIIVSRHKAGGKITELLEAYTTADAADTAKGNFSTEHKILDVVPLELKTSAPTMEATSAKAAAKDPVRKKSKVKAAPVKQKSDEEDRWDFEDDYIGAIQQRAVIEKKARAPEKRKQVPEGKDGSLNGLKLLFTGTFDLDRKTCEATAITYGAQIVTSMAKADYIVLGAKPGPKKVNEIEEKGYKTLNEPEFLDMIKTGSGEAEPVPAKKKKRST